MTRVTVRQILGGLALAFLCQWPALPENNAALPPAASAPALSCDSPYPDEQGNVTFVCKGLNDEQVRLMPAVSVLVDKLLHSGIDSASLDARSDDVVRLLQKSPEPKAERTSAAAEPSKATAPVAAQAAKVEVITYDYRGLKTSSISGPLLTDEGETEQYYKMLSLQKAGEWKKLVKAAAHEIKKVPEWLTPYAFKAVGLVHLHNKNDALAALEYVDQHSQGNPDYDQVRRLLKQLKPADQ